MAKLIGPTVVHIEADVPQQTFGALSAIGSSEAGSGVIVQRKGHFYVLTNRHVFRNTPADSIRVYLADGRRIHPQRVLEDEEELSVGVFAHPGLQPDCGAGG